MSELNKHIAENEIQKENIDIRDNAPIDEAVRQSEFSAVKDENNQTSLTMKKKSLFFVLAMCLTSV